MDEFIRKHSAIMDKYDPQKQVGLMVDEWSVPGTDQEPGTIGSAMHQQNSIRDALVAGINLNISVDRSDRPCRWPISAQLVSAAAQLNMILDQQARRDDLSRR